MRRSKLLTLSMAMALTAVLAAPAAAQDGPTITVEPSNVDAAGSATFTVTGTGWTATPPIFILPCDVPESGDLDDLSTDSCDTANLTPATPEDGSFELEVTFEIPEEGLVVAAGDAGQSEAAAALVTVGEATEQETTDDPVEETTTEDSGEASADEEDTEATEAADAADAELAQTGVETGLLTVIGLTIAALGAMIVGFSRRISTV